jgi:hypothetical protein
MLKNLKPKDIFVRLVLLVSLAALLFLQAALFKYLYEMLVYLMLLGILVTFLSLKKPTHLLFMIIAGLSIFVVVSLLVFIPLSIIHYNSVYVDENGRRHDDMDFGSPLIGMIVSLVLTPFFLWLYEKRLRQPTSFETIFTALYGIVTICFCIVSFIIA